MDIGLGVGLPSRKKETVIEQKQLSNFTSPAGGKFHFAVAVVLWQRLRLGGGFDRVKRGTEIYTNTNFYNEDLAAAGVEDASLLNRVHREITHYSIFVESEYFIKKIDTRKRGFLNIGFPFRAGITRRLYDDMLFREQPTNTTVRNYHYRDYIYSHLAGGAGFYYRATPNALLYIRYLHNFCIGKKWKQYASFSAGLVIDISFGGGNRKGDAAEKEDGVSKETETAATEVKEKLLPAAEEKESPDAVKPAPDVSADKADEENAERNEE